MATIKLLNNGRTYSEPPASPWINMVNGQYIANSTVTSNTVNCYLFRNASDASSVRSYITLGNSTVLTSTISESNFSYNYDVSNYQKVDVEFLDAGTIPGTNIVLQSINILPYVNISYSTSMGTTPSIQEVYYNSKITLANLPEIVVTNYIFDGWYYDSNYSSKANVGDSITSDTTLYAKFTLIRNIDFSTIKSLTIPEGVVKKITDSQGNVLWKEPETWHTIWSGSKSITWTNGSGAPSSQSNFAQSVAGQGTTPQIRVTFSISTSSIPSGATLSYYKNSTSTTSSKPGSPQTFTISSSKLIGVRCTDGSNLWKDVVLSRTNDTSNNRVKFNLSSNTGGSYPGGTLTVTITKIEQYYEES